MNRSRDEAECVPAEEWPNRRIIYLAIIVVLIAFLIFHLPEAIKTVFGIARDTIVVLILAVGLTYLLAPLHSLLMQVPWPPRKATRRQLYAIVAIVIFVGLLAGITKLVVTPLAEQTGQRCGPSETGSQTISPGALTRQSTPSWRSCPRSTSRICARG